VCKEGLPACMEGRGMSLLSCIEVWRQSGTEEWQNQEATMACMKRHRMF